MPYRLVSFIGIFVLICVAWLISDNRSRLNYRVISFGILIQFSFAAFIFVFPPGIKLFLWMNDAVSVIMNSASAGARFVFGPLALPPGTVNDSGEESIGYILAFQGFPTIIFFSALVSILYYTGVMQRIIGLFSFVFTRLLRISGAEALCASSNIFVGIESTLTVKPYLDGMTRSELMMVLTAGMSTVASNVLALYIFSLQPLFPTIAGHLLSASLLSAPAAIIMAKIIIPETGSPVTLGRDITPYYEKERNLFEAVINGANAGVKLIVGIAALLVAMLGIVALADMVLGGIGGRINSLSGITFDWSLPGLLGYVFYPFTLLLGVPVSDAGTISRIIGERMIVTELTAYQDLAAVMMDGALEFQRSAVICSYALCGFAHIASVAIFIGGISAIAPKTTHTLTAIGFRALIAATLACLMTACIAGVFYQEGTVLFG